jgi:hypothetical protein
MKKIIRFLFIFIMFLTACVPGAQYTLPSGITPQPGTDLPGQVASVVAEFLTQTAVPPTLSPIPVPSSVPIISGAQKVYQSSSFGIQFSYPEAWFLQELSSSQDIWGVTQQAPAILLTSFDPANPPHKLEWTDQTVSIQISYKVLLNPPGSFDAWIESTKQTLAGQISIYADERFLIANQPAARLTLVSGSGGTIDQVLTILNGRYFEINIETPNFNLAKTVLDTIQPISSSGLKPADSDTPAAGICSEMQGDPVNVILGIDSSGLPKAGRCVAVNPYQRIKLINQSNGPFNIKFAEYFINLSVGDEMLLDKPVGEYLALGVHFLPMGPELWVKTAASITPVSTVPPPIRQYTNSVVGYRLGLPGDWSVDESGMTNGTNKEVIFSPPYAEPFIVYLSISLEFRTLDQIINSYVQYHPEAVREDTIFNGYTAIKYNFPGGRNEYFIPYGNQIFLIATGRPNDGVVQSILLTVQFIASSSTTYEATLMDNGKTFNMKVGDKLKLNLDWNYAWSTTSISNPAVIAGFQDGYFALASGSSTLTLTGDPDCLNSTLLCGLPSIMFSITVIVQ